MSFFVLLLLGLSLSLVAAEAKEYVVGGSEGWSTGVDYNSWASSNTFSVGDTLVFQYGALHTVNEVSESDYSTCSASNIIQSFGNQNARIALTAPGTRYFICGAAGHCSEGMKLAIAVSSASTTPGSSFTPAIPEGSTITPPSATTPYQPYARPFYDGSGSGICTRSGLYGLLFAVFVVCTLLLG